MYGSALSEIIRLKLFYQILPHDGISQYEIFRYSTTSQTQLFMQIYKGFNSN